MSASDLLSSITGAPQGPEAKAVLTVYEITSAEEIVSQKAASDGARSALQNPGTAVGKPTVKTHSMTVQYNPSTLSIQANAEPIPYTQLQQNVDAGIPNQSLRPPMVTLSVELYFDDMNPQDAFMLDKLNLTAGSVVSDVAAAKRLKNGGYSVQPQTNALLSTVLRPNTKLVSFAWGDMRFTGQITEVEADYLMFSPSGKPIRSRVQLNIAQAVESSADSGYWDAALDRGLGTGKSMAKKLGNALNLDSF